MNINKETPPGVILRKTLSWTWQTEAEQRIIEWVKSWGQKCCWADEKMEFIITVKAWVVHVTN